MSEKKVIFDIDEIKKILPHRYPFLLVDKVIEFEEGKFIRAVKNVTVNEIFFNGHFPEYPVMPGVLIVEALAQTGAILILKTLKKEGQIAFFAGIDKLRFKKQVRPGDQLILEVTPTKIKGSVGKAKAEAYVDGELAVSGEIMFMTKK